MKRRRAVHSTVSVRHAIQLVTLCLCCAVLAQEDGAKKEEKPAGNLKLPKGVHHEVLEDGKHRYTITCREEEQSEAPKDAREPSPVEPKPVEPMPVEPRPVDPRIRLEIDLLESYKKLIPGCASFTWSQDGRSITFETESELADLKRTVNGLARWGWSVPFWEELEARDLRAPEFKKDLFALVHEAPVDYHFIVSAHAEKRRLLLTLASSWYMFETEKEPSTNAREYAVSVAKGRFTLEPVSERTKIPRKVVDSVAGSAWGPRPIRHGKGLEATAKLNSTFPHCMAEDRLALRIFDKTGRFIWEDLTNVFGHVGVTTADLDGDELDEIIVTRNDHGKCALLIFQLSAVAKRTEKPATK